MLATFEIDCEAPPNDIVRACTQLGVERPEDVRWCPLKKHMIRLSGGFFYRLWKFFSGRKRPMCNCGMKMPLVDLYQFEKIESKVILQYLLGQCKRCKRVYWQQIVY